MFEALLETAELFVPVLYGLAAAAVTSVGLLAELRGVTTLLGGGRVGLSVWFAFMGAVALYVGVVLLGRRAVAAVRERAA